MPESQQAFLWGYIYIYLDVYISLEKQDSWMNVSRHLVLLFKVESIVGVSKRVDKIYKFSPWKRLSQIAQMTYDSASLMKPHIYKDLSESSLVQV